MFPRAPALLRLICLGLSPLGPAPAEELDHLLLKDYSPVSLYRIPATTIDRAAYPVIDIHSHSFFAKTREEVRAWVAAMDRVGIERTILLTQATGAEFDRIAALYAEFPERFELWCGFDYRGFDQPGYGPAAVAELERCVRRGAKGVGEVSDKGDGLMIEGRSTPSNLHLDDPRLDPLLEKCAELNLPVNFHVADPIWMYQKMDRHNEGMPNAAIWRRNPTKDSVDPSGLIDQLERTLQRHPRTPFIACHLANLDYDLARLGRLLDHYPNLQCDISSRYAETSTIPRVAAAFFEKYRDRLMYGTDMEFTLDMYRTTFRILESTDDHFYGVEQFCYLWPLSGLGLSQETLRRIYRENALNFLGRRRLPAR